MARKHKHEDHINHEAWAIPYGDLMTLLLAFFVVMYATSSVNEGRYRVLADSLSQAFGGPPKSMQPVQIGDKPQKGSQPGAVFTSPSMRGFEKEPSRLHARAAGGEADGGKHANNLKAAAVAGADADARGGLQQMAEQVEAALQDLIREKLVVVRRNADWLEIEIRTDILFPSGVAQLSPRARPALRKLADVLKPFDQMLRIEGHTDNVPIATSVYPSNWELSAARAASVVHLFMESGVAPVRMSVAGFGEYQPVGDNGSAEGRNHNRRVVIVALDAHKPPPQTAQLADARLTAALDNTQLQPASTESAPMSEAARRNNDGPFERWVCFGLGEVIYGLPILRVQEVLQVPPIEPVPGTSPTTLGVINLRGQVVVVLDLRLHLGFVASPPSADARIIVIEHRGEMIGLLVDCVTDVRKLAEAAIKPVPGVDAERRAPILGIVSRGGEMLSLLDIERLLA